VAESLRQILGTERLKACKGDTTPKMGFGEQSPEAEQFLISDK